MAWHSKGANHAIVRPRLQRPSPAPHVPPATWPTIPIPHPAGGITYARSREEHQRYLEDTAPAEEPPDPGHEKARPLERGPGGVPAQPTEAFGFTEFGQVTPAPNIIRRILNARKDRT